MLPRRRSPRCAPPFCRAAAHRATLRRAAAPPLTAPRRTWCCRPGAQVLWRYFEKDSNEQHYIWTTGTVKRIADGLTDKRSERAKKILPAGALLWAWDADADYEEVAGEQWLHLLPQKWNTQQVYGWRFDPRELSAAASPPRDARRCNAVRADAMDA